MKLSNSKSIILFRFHDNPQRALSRIRLLREFNNLDIHVLYGGEEKNLEDCRKVIQPEVSSFWTYTNKTSKWRWIHGDLLVKNWYREIGNKIPFEFVFILEYDMVILKPLKDIYPDIGEDSIALAACEPFTKEIESNWSWTSREEDRPDYLKFKEYMHKNYGIERQAKVCLGPGPLLSRKFLDAWSKTEDVDFVNDEIAYPAYAEALGFKALNHGMHPGFSASDDEERFFNCNRKFVSQSMIKEELSKPDGIRAFHPVKDELTEL